jgi:hypothetical protein
MGLPALSAMKDGPILSFNPTAGRGNRSCAFHKKEGVEEAMEKTEALMDAAVKLVHQATRILVFTGAGMSTESGIPDFRSPGGIWSKYDPSDFLYHGKPSPLTPILF